jgi:hypothetical protein
MSLSKDVMHSEIIHLIETIYTSLPMFKDSNLDKLEIMLKKNSERSYEERDESL